jgi:hypothetical protein
MHLRISFWAIAPALLLASSAALPGGSIVLNGISVGEATVGITENASGTGSGGFQAGSCIGDCLLAGQGSLLGFTFPWSITGIDGLWSFTPPSTSSGSLTVSGEFAEFVLSDSSDTGGGDRIEGDVYLTSFIDNGNGTAELIGTLTITSVMLAGSDSAEFENLLSLGGVSIVGGVAIPSVLPLDVNITGCMNGASASVCFPDPSTVSITGAVSSVALGAAQTGVPEPGTLVLSLAGLAGLAWVGRKLAP